MRILVTVCYILGEQEKVTLTNYSLKETRVETLDGGRKWSRARSIQN